MRVLAKQSQFSSTPPTSANRHSFTVPPSTSTLTSLRASLTKQPNSKINWDNACSYHVTNDSTLLSQMQKIPTDNFLGIGGSSSVTHVGYLPFLPSKNFMNVCYFAPDFPQTLLSLGQLQTCGGAYSSHNNPNVVKIYAIASDHKSLIDTAPLTPGTNLLATTPSLLNKSILENLSLSVINKPTPPPTFPKSLQEFVINHPFQQTNKSSFLATHRKLLHFSSLRNAFPFKKLKKIKIKWPMFSENPIDLSLCQIIKQPSTEQLRLAYEALDLHEACGHPPDKKLCHDLSTGKHPHSTLTPASVILMRQIVGPCPHCLEGRASRPAASHPVSTSPPTEKTGEVISFDPQKLPNPVLGNFTHKITMVDKRSGFISQPGSTSKSTGPVFDAIHGVITKQYNANNHKVAALHCDAENINISLRPKFGALGTRVLANLPGEHAQVAERTTQTIQDRARAVSSGLPYYQPPELNLLLSQAVGECLNHTTNKASHPSTPYELLCASNSKLLQSPSADAQWLTNQKTNVCQYQERQASHSRSYQSQN